jgi:uncharacterized phiE125 gp8 family phage protein
MLGSAVTVTPPAGELIPLEQAKSFVRVEGTELDAEIGMMAAAAGTELEKRTGLRLLNQQVKVTADRFADLDRFRVGPVREIASISYRDQAGAEQVLAAELYELFGGYLEQGARPAFGESWPTPAQCEAAIAVTLDVGFGEAAADVPPHLRLAAYALFRGKFDGDEVDVDQLIVNDRFLL